MSGTIPQHVFISFAHRDQEIAWRVAEVLRKAGISVWIDYNDLAPGTPDWESTIRNAIDASLAVILLASPEARQSQFVKGELSFAKARRCQVLPLWVEGNEWIDSVPLDMSATQHIDCRGECYSKGMERVVKILRDMIASTKPRQFKENLLTPGSEQKTSRAGRTESELKPELDYLLELLADGRVRAWELRQPWYTVGRSGVSISLTDRKVSRRHLVLARLGLDWFVIKASRKNSLMVAGWKLRQKRLHDGDVMRAGATWLVFLAGNASTEGPPLHPMGGRWRTPNARTQQESAPPATAWGGGNPVTPENTTKRGDTPVPGPSVSMDSDQTYCGIPTPSAHEVKNPLHSENQGSVKDDGDASHPPDNLFDSGFEFELPSRELSDSSIHVPDIEYTDLPPEDSFDDSLGSLLEDGICRILGPEELAASNSVERPLLIGSHPRCAVCVAEDGVAPFHCFLTWCAGEVFLFDLGSGRGTLLDGQPIRHAPVKDGQQITVGSRTLTVEICGDTEQPAKGRKPRDLSVLALTVLSGPHAGESALLPIGRSMVLGRSDRAELSLPGDKKISRQHLQLTVKPHPGESGELVVEVRDVGSRNGARINLEILTGNSTAKVGDVIGIGKSAKTEETALLLHYDLSVGAWL